MWLYKHVVLGLNVCILTADNRADLLWGWKQNKEHQRCFFCWLGSVFRKHVKIKSLSASVPITPAPVPHVQIKMLINHMYEVLVDSPLLLPPPFLLLFRVTEKHKENKLKVSKKNQNWHHMKFRDCLHEQETCAKCFRSISWIITDLKKRLLSFMWKLEFISNSGHFKGLEARKFGAVVCFIATLWELSHAGFWSHILRAQAPFFPLHSPISFSCSMHEAHIWKLARESLRRGRDLLRLARATRRQSHAIAAIWDYEQREKICNFIETPGRVSVFVAKMQSGGTGAFSGGALGRFGGETAISEAFVLGRSATKVDKSCKAWLLLVL